MGGSVIFFRCFSSWKGVDPVNVTPYVIQVAVIVSVPLLGARFALRHPDVGGLDGLLAKLEPAATRLLPDFGKWQLTVTGFVNSSPPIIRVLPNEHKPRRVVELAIGFG